jgi:cyclic 2,3-diphosphoglycerate synthetase
MGRGGPAEPRVAPAETTLEDLVEIVDGGGHGASDYLEDAVLARVRTVGCRRVGGGFAGEPFDSNVVEGAALAASLEPGAIVFEGSGACIPPVEVDATVCIVGRGEPEPFAEYRTLRADLVLEDLELRPEPTEELPDGARVAVFTTGAEAVEGVEAEVFSTNLSRRRELAEDLKRAADCDVFLTEVKAAAIDTVAARAREAGARLIFIRNRPVGIDHALMELLPDA